MGRRRTKSNYFIEVADDGLLSYEIGPWAEDKYRRLGMYAEMFATGMKNAWETRVLLDLFAGPGAQPIAWHEPALPGITVDHLEPAGSLRPLHLLRRQRRCGRGASGTRHPTVVDGGRKLPAGRRQ